jgi:hypothetical protein
VRKILSIIILFALASSSIAESKYYWEKRLKSRKFYKQLLKDNPNAVEKNISMYVSFKDKKQPESIRIDDANITDFSSLSECDELKTLSITNGIDIDIASIPSLPGLMFLDIEDCSLKNIKDFKNISNRYAKITLKNCNLMDKDIAFFKDLDAKIINIAENPGITNIDFLKEKKRLTGLSISGTKVSDLSPLENSNIEELLIQTATIQNLKPLFTCSRLKKLAICSSLKDVEQLKKITNLQSISCNDERISYYPEKMFWELLKKGAIKLCPQVPFSSESETKEELEKQKDEENYANLQKEMKGKIDFKFSDVKKNLVIVEHEKGCGSGFVAKDGEDTYIYTNQHVVFGAKKLKFKTLTGEYLKPVGFELSQERDVIRFKLKDHPNALEINTSPVMEEPVAVFGNSAGGGVATEIFGKVTGIGAEKIEVSARFVQGNSGSPVFDKNKKVLGMATYVTRALTKGDWVKKGTRFEKPRYFAFKVDNSIAWKSMKWKVFQRLGQKIMDDKEGIEEIVALIKTWLKAPYSSINDDDYKEQDIRTWIKKHNSMAKKHQKQKDKGCVRNAKKLSQINKAIRDDLEENYQSLSALCERRSKAIKFKTQRYEKYLTKYIQTENEQNQASLKFLGEKINEIGAKIAATDAFYLQERRFPSY